MLPLHPVCTKVSLAVHFDSLQDKDVPQLQHLQVSTLQSSRQLVSATVVDAVDAYVTASPWAVLVAGASSVVVASVVVEQPLQVKTMW